MNQTLYIQGRLKRGCHAVFHNVFLPHDIFLGFVSDFILPLRCCLLASAWQETRQAWIFIKSCFKVHKAAVGSSARHWRDEQFGNHHCQAKISKQVLAFFFFFFRFVFLSGLLWIESHGAEGSPQVSVPNLAASSESLPASWHSWLLLCFWFRSKFDMKRNGSERWSENLSLR